MFIESMHEQIVQIESQTDRSVFFVFTRASLLFEDDLNKRHLT